MPPAARPHSALVSRTATIPTGVVDGPCSSPLRMGDSTALSTIAITAYTNPVATRVATGEPTRLYPTMSTHARVIPTVSRTGVAGFPRASLHPTMENSGRTSARVARPKIKGQ